MILSICPLTDYIHGSQMKTLNFVVVLQLILQEYLSFYCASKLTLYVSEMRNSVYFLFNAPQSCVTSISKWGGTSTDLDCELGLDVKYSMDLA